MEKNILQKCATLKANHRVRIIVKFKNNHSLKAKIRKFNDVVQIDPDDEGQYDDYIETKQEYDKLETLCYHNVVIQSSEQKCRIMMI